MQLDIYNYDGKGSNSINRNYVFGNYRQFETSLAELYGDYKLSLDNKAVFDIIKIIDVDNYLYERYQYVGRKL